MSWDESNTFNLLKGLYSLGYLKRNGDTFCNMPETSKYLVKGKPAYMGSVLTFFCNNQGMSLGNVAQQVKEGPKPQERTQHSMDFAAYGDAMRDAQSGIPLSNWASNMSAPIWPTPPLPSVMLPLAVMMPMRAGCSVAL